MKKIIIVFIIWVYIYKIVRKKFFYNEYKLNYLIKKFPKPIISLVNGKLHLDGNDNKAFDFHFKADNLKMIPGDYKVNASSTAQVSNWIGSEASYWIALEHTSD